MNNIFIYYINISWAALCLCVFHKKSDPKIVWDIKNFKIVLFCSFHLSFLCYMIS